jgi:hypothetical protein
MRVLKDCSGEFGLDLKLEDFSKDALVWVWRAAPFVPPRTTTNKITCQWEFTLEE